jgi:flagellar assembly factor FliW
MLLNNSPGTAPRKSMNDEVISGVAEAASLMGKEIYFPEGLLGFPDEHRFILSRFHTRDGSQSPFFVLDSVNGALSFPLIHPDLLSWKFPLPVLPELLDCLQAANGADQLVPLLIVTMRDSVDDITVNLQGPLVLNPVSLRGAQMVIENFPLCQPLLSSNAPDL